MVGDTDSNYVAGKITMPRETCPGIPAQMESPTTGESTSMKNGEWTQESITQFIKLGDGKKVMTVKNSSLLPHRLLSWDVPPFCLEAQRDNLAGLHLSWQIREYTAENQTTGSDVAGRYLMLTRQ